MGRNYAIVISTSCGLWRYILGDTVKFTQKDPYKFIISGRTKHFINAFGEELMVDNAEKDWHVPAPKPEHKCWNILPHRSSWTTMPNAVTSAD